MEVTDQETSKEPETIRLILATALQEYKDELDRFKQFESKTTPMVAATGAVLVFVAGTMTKPPLGLPAFWRGVFFGGVCLTLLVLAAAQAMFLFVLWGRSFERIAVRELLTSDWLTSRSDELVHSLADKYCSLVAHNSLITNTKAAYHKWGLILLNVGLALLVLLLAAAGATAGSTS